MQDKKVNVAEVWLGELLFRGEADSQMKTSPINGMTIYEHFVLPQVVIR